MTDKKLSSFDDLFYGAKIWRLKRAVNSINVVFLSLFFKM
jgi:hypothetical protein